jgi:hypothetical protein
VTLERGNFIKTGLVEKETGIAARVIIITEIKA